jgi:hypothetical protein
VVLTAWNEKRGAEAVSVLGTLGLSNVLAHQLHVSDPSSAVRLADFIKESLASLICSPCSLGLSTTSQQYFSLTTNQPPATSQQYSSLRTNQHQPSARRWYGRILVLQSVRSIVHTYAGI